MSYCRPKDGHSDVYLYRDKQGIFCVDCNEWFTIPEAITHLFEHRDSGDLVPDVAFDLLLEEFHQREAIADFLRESWASARKRLNEKYGAVKDTDGQTITNAEARLAREKRKGDG